MCAGDGGLDAHLGVAVVTVGGEEDLRHLLNPAQEEGQIGLWRTRLGISLFPPAVRRCSARFTHVFHHELVQVLDGFLLQDPLASGTKKRRSRPTPRARASNPFSHRVVDEVHGGADVVEHAPVGHDEVSVFEALGDAGRGRSG